MFQSLDVFKTAMAMARHAGQMQSVSAQNIANADTPNFRAKDVPDFKQTLRNSLTGQRATRQSHINGSTDRTIQWTDRREDQDPNGNSVSLELEMVRAVDAKRQHDRALAIYRNSMKILRTSLGKS